MRFTGKIAVITAFNLSGTFLFTHAVVPIMKRRRQGNVSKHKANAQSEDG